MGRKEMKKIYRLFTVLAFTFGFFTIMAQPLPCAVDPENPQPLPPHCVPIDGGISLLIAAGLFYGGNEARKKFKKID